MEYFSIIQALCRAAIADALLASRKQIERLRDVLAKDGEVKKSAALTSILTAADRNKELSPSRIERSKAQFSGEVLTRKTPIPVDRETAAALADILPCRHSTNRAALQHDRQQRHRDHHRGMGQLRRAVGD